MSLTNNTQAIKQGRLEATPPFDFGKTLNYLRAFPPTAMDQAVADDSFIKAFQVQGRTLAASIKGSASVDQPHLTYTLFSDKRISRELESAFTDRLSSMLSLADDLSPFYALAGRDPQFQPILQSLFGYHPVRFQSGFEAAVWAILSQRNRMATARNMYRNLVRSFGHKAEVDGITCWAFPEPEELAGCSEGDLAFVARNLRRVVNRFFVASLLRMTGLGKSRVLTLLFLDNGPNNPARGGTAGRCAGPQRRSG